MLAGVESMRRHRDILFGCFFTWVTDHKGLTHLLQQKNLSARQARWIEKISEFKFGVEHLPGPLNVLPDALSCKYFNDAPGTACAASDYTEHDDEEDLPLCLASFAASDLPESELISCAYRYPSPVVCSGQRRSEASAFLLPSLHAAECSAHAARITRGFRDRPMVQW